MNTEDTIIHTNSMASTTIPISSPTSTGIINTESAESIASNNIIASTTENNINVTPMETNDGIRLVPQLQPQTRPQSQPQPLSELQSQPMETEPTAMPTPSVPTVTPLSTITPTTSPMPNKPTFSQTTSQQQNDTKQPTVVKNVNSLDTAALLTKTRLRELVKEVDPNEQLEEDVEDLLLQLSDDFVDELVKAACAFAKHRKSNMIEVKDVQLYLERYLNMWIPGFGTDELRAYKKAPITEAHKQRTALIKKVANKKY
ncbi:transcription initiation factor TFIID subunit 12 [Adelges cooleyi]|uniref:transcription initiation factor TFIID subunit 12 n=1 Tax=Adelges cooleyi TaxID=133065 RepID=UPI0021803A6D|nr:transcription initiation factor TFIID subunit 12 [Adelges cooleyi]